MEKKKDHITLRARVFIFFAAFLLALIGLIYATWFQSSYIVSALENQSGSFYNISQLMAAVEDILSTLGEYNFSYDDPDLFADKMESDRGLGRTFLSRLDMNLNDISEDQYLLTRAVRATYDTYDAMLGDILTEVKAGRNDSALELYAADAEPCGGYLILYVQQLLETAISDGQSTYAELTTLGRTVRNISSVLAVCCLILGGMVAFEVLQILNPLQKLAEASRAISRGEYDGPDLPEKRRDEVGEVEKAFNQMKHSTAQQVQTLNDKNRIERELHENEKETLRMQNLAEREKLQQLRAQIDPHFLFNTLNVISITALQEEAPRTRELINDLSNLLRYSLLSNDLWVPLSQEIRIINGYFEIYHTRFGDRMAMEWRIQDDIDLTETMVPSLILQPLVENAFRHGLTPKEEGGLVTIYIRLIREWGLLCLCVADNGTGMEKEQLKKLQAILKDPSRDSSEGEHIGLSNVAARLKLTDERCRMNLTSRLGKGTRVTVFIPLVEEGDLPGEEDISPVKEGEDTDV